MDKYGLKNKIWRIQHPTVFQGKLNSKIYFEGWYYKLCSSDFNSIYAIIPGISLNKKSNTSHSFIQILNGKTAEYYYIKFPIENFSYSFKPHKIEIGQNIFTENNIDLKIKSQNAIEISGSLDFDKLTSLPYNKFSPGIMGPLSYFPLMQTYHGIVSMNHTIHGNLKINGKLTNFTNGKGYIEKDWGSAFPSEWIWMQSNHFKENKRSFVFSVAKIPYIGLKFKGFFAMLWDKGKFYKFSTYNGSRYKIKEITNKKVSLQIRNKRNGIIIDIDAEKSNNTKNDLTAIMKTPVNGEMINKTAETMSATIKLHLYSNNSYLHRQKNLQIDEFTDFGKYSGLEIMGFRHKN